MANDFPTPEQFDTDFNVNDEYKPDPLCPQGNYTGHVTNVKFDPVQQAIVWEVVLQGNDGYMSDGETPIDGARFFYRNWLPRSGDENTMTSSGRSTKRQAKINMMQQFASGMQVLMSTKEEIVEALSEGLWLGIPVLVKMNNETYEGRTSSRIQNMVRNPEGEIVEVTPPDDDIPF